ncbi:MAG TPA: 50S ribosomal protein L11 methyltransferase [Bacteroidia bacterium]|nr:50S ribosomal protein L11 methyltransferase [Bacteroidia bacterium]
MQYLEFEIPCNSELGEILVAELSQIGFDSFLQEEDFIKAYVEESLLNFEELRLVLDYYGISSETVNKTLLENKNWNEVWESNYHPVVIGDKCYIRASFHEAKPQYPYEILLQPKMSFGTGHHATTAQMMELMLVTDFRNKTVLDMGCGSGLLAILAYKMGASQITAVDNDEWAYKNTLENIFRNKIQHTDVILGDIEDVKNEKFDIILSNITKNINIELFPSYQEMIEKSGKLIVSGFFETDLEEITSNAIKYGFRLLSNKTKNNWIAAIFTYDEKI